MVKFILSILTANTYHKETYLFNNNSDTWTRGPNMRRGKKFHTCSLATQKDGKSVVVIVGGYEGSCQYQNDVEVLDLETNNIHSGILGMSVSHIIKLMSSTFSGQNLPIYLHGHTSLSFEDRVVILGGEEGINCNSRKDFSKAIYL